MPPRARPDEDDSVCDAETALRQACPREPRIWKDFVITRFLLLTALTGLGVLERMYILVHHARLYRTSAIALLPF